MDNTVHRTRRNSAMNASLSVTALSGDIHWETPMEERTTKIKDPVRIVSCTSPKSPFPSKQTLSTSCQSFLIINSRTIVLDVNLNDVSGSFDKNFTRSIPATSNFEGPQGKPQTESITLSNKDLDATREKQIYFTRPVSKRCQHQNNVSEKWSKKGVYFPGIQIKEKESESSEKASIMSSGECSVNRIQTKNKKAELKTSKKASGECSVNRIQSKNKKSELKSSKKASIRSSNKCSVNRIQPKNKPNHSEKESFRCEVCWKCFPTKRGVSRHAELHNLINCACEVCGKIFNTRDNLGKHRRTVHARIRKSIKCPNCYKCYANQRNLNIHLKKYPGHLSPPLDEL